METNENDRWRQLFAGMPDEALPLDFNEKVMVRIEMEAVLREKKRRYWEILGYASGFAAMLITCVVAFFYFDVSFQMPEKEPFMWSFPRLDPDLLTSPSFALSFKIGALALFLLIIDSTIRRHIGRKG